MGDVKILISSGTQGSDYLVVDASMYSGAPQLTFRREHHYPEAYDSTIGRYRRVPDSSHLETFSTTELCEISRTMPAEWMLAYLLASGSIAEKERQEVALFLARRLLSDRFYSYVPEWQ